MLGKKIRRLLITIISTVLITIGFMTTLHNNWGRVIPNKVIEHKIDMTEFKIKEVINNNKLQTLEINLTVKMNDSEYDKSNIEWLDKLSKMFTMRKITIEGDYKAILSLDLSKSIIRNNIDNTYTIIVSAENVECNVISTGEAKINENLSPIGRYYKSQSSARVINELNKITKDAVFTQQNINTTVNNAVNNLTKLLESVGVDMSKVHIESNLMEMERVVK